MRENAFEASSQASSGPRSGHWREHETYGRGHGRGSAHEDSSERAETAEEAAERRDWEEMLRQARESRAEELADSDEIRAIKHKYLKLVLLIFGVSLVMKLAAMKAVSLMRETGLIQARPEAFGRSPLASKDELPDSKPNSPSGRRPDSNVPAH